MVRLTRIGAKSHRWFIDQKNLRRQHKSATECQHLLLATGEAAGELTTTLGKPRKSFEADGEIARELGPRSRAIGAEQEIFFDRQHRKQSAPLRHERDAEIDDVLRGAADQVVMNAVDFRDDRAFARPHYSHDAFHERRLAVAVGAEQHNGLATAYLERHILDDAHRAISGMDAGDGQAIGQGKPFRPQDHA